MNPNFDFRDSNIWDDRSIEGSVGDDLQELVRFLGMCLVMFVIGSVVVLWN